VTVRNLRAMPQASSSAPLPLATRETPESVVASAIGPRSRVAVVGKWESLLDRLAAAGCDVLAAPVAGDAAIAELKAFRPDAIVLSEGIGAAQVEAWLDRVGVDGFGARDIVVVFANASASSRLLAALVGVASSDAIADAWVRERLERAGLDVRERHVVRGPQSPLPLAADAERSLRKLFSQLNPSADDEQLVYIVRRSAARAPRRDLVSGLVSVVVRNHDLSRLPLLDQTIFSLAGQRHPSLEIVVVTQARDEDAVPRIEGVLERHRSYGGYEYQVLQHPTDRDERARLANLGVQAARGQYVAFLDDDDVVYPDHYERLVAALQKSHAAWAFAPVRRAWFTRDPQGNLYCKRKDVYPGSDRWDRVQFMRDNYITCHSYVIDRERVGRFHIAFSEELSKNEDYILLLRMAALFRPVAVGGHPSCEYRIRDDGTNSIMASATTPEEAQRLHAEWQLANAMKDAIKRPLQILITQDELDRDASVPHGPPALPGLRHQFIDRGNEILKTRAPRLHRALKRMAEKVVKR